MRPYETLIVLRTDLGEEGAKLLTRFETVITGQGGSIDENRDWGVRDLAYPISKQRQGHYHLLEYQAEPQTVKELERNLRIVEGVMRFVSVQQDHTGLPEPRVREHYDRRETPEKPYGGDQARAQRGAAAVLGRIREKNHGSDFARRRAVAGNHRRGRQGKARLCAELSVPAGPRRSGRPPQPGPPRAREGRDRGEEAARARHLREACRLPQRHASRDRA